MSNPVFNGKIVFPPESRVETLVGQMQKNFPYYIYVKDGWLSSYFTNLDEVPSGNYVIEDGSPELNQPEYYLRDLDTDIAYTVFTPELRDRMLSLRK